MKVIIYLRIFYRMLLFICIALTIIVVGFLLKLVITDSKIRRRYSKKMISIASYWSLKLMRIHLNLISVPPANRHYLYVSNHLGMLDILLLAAVRPSLFITSVDMRETPFVGLLTEMGGCLYVERRNRSNIQKEILDIREVLKQGHSIVLYPEGKAHSGEHVLPFKKTLLTAAAGTGVPIMPVVINFRKVNGEPMSGKWREHVFWWGDQTFIGALTRIMSVDSMDVDLEFLEEVFVENEEQRREIAARIQKSVEQKYIPIL